MAIHRLTWRVALPFVLLVMIETVALAMFLGRQVATEERARLERVAAANAAFLENSSLPTSDRMAESLRSISGYEVFFRRRGQLVPQPAPELSALPLVAQPADGRAMRSGQFDCIVMPIANKDDLVLVHRLLDPWVDSRVTSVLVAFVLLALLTAWLVGRDLVRPLRHLANQLPRIESSGPLALPEAERRDEIGDLARSFLRTRQELHDERAARERMEQLAVLGRMTAALAHEVQNPVAAIRMHAQLWQQSGGGETAATIEHEAMRIESMLNQWMFLTRPEPPAMALVDLGPQLERVVALHRTEAAHAAVRVTVSTAAGLTVAGDRRRLDQVFHNLLINALQAMPGGGTLSIRASRHDGEVLVEFDDTGTGFSAQALQRFAEFFFSEKEGGMGIGLAVASEITKAHGGRLVVENRAGDGASVRVVLPAAIVDPVPSTGLQP